MRNTCCGTALLLSAILGSVSGCSTTEAARDQETVGSVSQDLSQADIVVCTGSCAETFGGKPSSKYPVYIAMKSVTPPSGGTPETVVTAAFLMKCGANTEDAARAFGYDPRTTSATGIDRLEPFDTLESLQARLGGRSPVKLDCTSPPFFRVFRRIDASHSAANPAYYLQLRKELVDDAAALGGERPPSIYALDCANPLMVLWEGWTSGQQPDAILSKQATPINAAVVNEWTQTMGMATPTIFCGSSTSYRSELPVNPPTNTRTVAAPTNAGAELYYVRSSFDGVTNASGAYYLISNGLGYAIDGCGAANIGELAEMLGLPVDSEIPDLPVTDPKFIASNPNGQPVLRCDDVRARVFESINAPTPYKYLSFGNSELSSMVRFACKAPARFFFDRVSSPRTTQVPEESLQFLSGSGKSGQVLDIGCAKEVWPSSLDRLRLSPDLPAVLEIEHDGEWRGVCGHYFGIENAEVACRQMGYLGVESYDTAVTKNSSAYWLDAVFCDGSERNIGECERAEDHQQWGVHDCETGDHVSIKCSSGPTAFAPIRINWGEWILNTAGEWEFEDEGERLEAYYQGQWRGVCDDEFDLVDAQVACREQGWSAVASFSGGVSTSSATYALDDLRCVGNEKNLSDCPNAGLGTHNCGTGDHVRLVCDDTSKVPLQITNDWSLKAQHQGQWYTACGDGFSWEEASAACRQLGYCGVARFGYPNVASGSTETFWKYGAQCNGDEWSLSDCANAGLGTTGSCAEYVRLRCDHTCSVVPLLFGNYLEAYDQGKWYGICDDDFDMADAQVACRQLGYSRAVGFTSEISADSEEYRFDDLACTGNEQRLSDCPHVGIDGENCGSSEHVQVTCK